MKVKSAFGKELLKPHDLDVYEDLDVCGPIRHWLAFCGLCKHLTEKIKTRIHVPGLRQVFTEHYKDIPGDTTETESLTTEEHLAAVVAEWGLIYDYRVPFSSIMGVEKWVEICEVFFVASRHLDEE